MSVQKLQYLDPSLVLDKRQTAPPPIRSRTGYGAKLPSTWMLRIASVSGVRWHRVYIMYWSNAGTAYVIIRGERVLLGSYDPGDNVPTSVARSGSTKEKNDGKANQ